jgi:hypothetical protein
MPPKNIVGVSMLMNAIVGASMLMNAQEFSPQSKGTKEDVLLWPEPK